MVRLGRFGEAEAHALESGNLITGWNIEQLGADRSRAQIASALEQAYSSENSGTLQNWAVQINQFANVISEGDLIIVPLKTSACVAIGRVTGAFYQTAEGAPARRVRWLRPDLPRDAVKQDLLYSLGASQTVCEISRNDAARRFESMAELGVDTGLGTASRLSTAKLNDPVDTQEPEGSMVDVAINARDQIERHIAVNFSGHTFTQLVAAILRAQGYQTRVSPPGTDRGVDIVAGQGALGFESPRLIVQVKSGTVVADQPTLQSLLGCISDTHAEHGLLVSWAGFTSAVRQRVNELYFRVRLWDREEIMSALFSVYDKLPEEIRTDLPLRRIWALVEKD